MSTTIHVSLDIEGALRRPGYWRKLFRFNGKTPDIDSFRSFHCDELRAGRKAVPLGCPTPNADGTCPGHAKEEPTT